MYLIGTLSSSPITIKNVLTRLMLFLFLAVSFSCFRRTIVQVKERMEGVPRTVTDLHELSEDL